LNEWIGFDKKFFHDLSLLNEHKSIHSWTVFDPNKKETKYEKIKRYGKNIALGIYTLWDSETNRKKIIQFEFDHPYQTIPIDDARNAINSYDVLKRSCSALLKNLDFLLMRPDLENIEAVLKIKSELNEFFKNVAFTRSNYISYDVISPNLNRAKQLIFLSENAKLLSIGHESDLLREAVKVMEQGAYHDIILQAHQDVRDEFLEVYKLLKNTAGSAEFEELKVFGTLQDKIGRERMLGYERWQNQ